MSVEVVTIAAGEPRQQVLNLPKRLTITVTREDGYAPSQPEIYTAMTIALESMTPKKKPRKNSPKITD
ncbi:hypothetical protein [Massilia sp. TN1-12]|uniref:hypothetical protein n=1 Tax=Massilia paldalensis TaxID=3377675 RepID=UPI003850E8AB